MMRIDKYNFHESRIFEYIDHGSFRLVDNNFIADANGVYWLESESYKDGTLLDKDSYKRWQDYFKREDFIEIDSHSSFVDRNTIEKVFFVRLNGVDVKNFQRISPLFQNNESCGIHNAYYCDGSNAYYLNYLGWGFLMRLKSNNPDDFIALDCTCAKDNKKVFYLGKWLRGADASTFVSVDGKQYQYRDKRYSYYNDNWYKIIKTPL